MNEPRQRCRFDTEERVTDKQRESYIEADGMQIFDLLRRPLRSVQNQKNPKRYETEDGLRRYRVGDAAVHYRTDQAVRIADPFPKVEAC